jgi:hypothetical protein
MTPWTAGRPPPRARQARHTRRSSGQWPYAGPGTWPARAGRKTPSRPARIPGLPRRRTTRRRMIPTPRGSYTRWRIQRRRRLRRTPGRPVRSPRCGWWRTRLRSARTPTCRWNGSPVPGPRLQQAVPRSPPQPRPPPGRDIGPSMVFADVGTRNAPPGSGARWPWFEIRQLTDVFHCNLQHHLSCNRPRALQHCARTFAGSNRAE